MVKWRMHDTSSRSLIIGLRGLQLTSLEKAHLISPSVAGVILFARNFESKAQLAALVDEVQTIRPMIVSVDHEGGPVQRFKGKGFTTLPAADQILTEAEAFERGALMGEELTAVGVTLNFAPVVDLQHPHSRVLKGRCLGADPVEVACKAMAIIKGMQSAGCDGVIKHFPGHGSVAGDTHHQKVVDSRSFEEIAALDLLAFQECVQEGAQNVMAAWVTYPAVDDHPACYSEYWLKNILREKLAFQGKVFSDDIGMQAALFAHEPAEAVRQALAAGCDYALLCNDFKLIDQICQMPFEKP